MSRSAPPLTLDALGSDLWREIPGVGIAIVDAATGTWLDVNDAFGRMLGYTREELTQRSFRGLSHPDDLAASEAAYQRIRAHLVDGYRLDKRYLRKDGSSMWCDLTVRRLGTSDILIGTMVDITERKEAERQLRDLFEHAAEGILVLDVDTRCYADANPVACAMLGHAREGIVGQPVYAISADVQPGGVSVDELLARATQEVMAGHALVAEWNAQHADGHIVPCELRVTRLPVVGRRLLRGTIVDISERVEARAELERLQNAIDSSVTGVVMTDPSGRLTYVNRTALQLSGFDQETDMVGRHIRRFWRLDDAPSDVQHAIELHGQWTGQVRVIRRDATERLVEVHASAVRDAHGQLSGVLASIADVTETRRLEHELQQAQKLESVGRLAGGVAHDFNNLLTVIKGSLELASAALPAESDALVDLREVNRAADSAARLTQQLLAFSRKQVIAPTTLNLNEVVTRVAGMLQRLLGEDIVLHTVTAHDLGYARFDAGQAEQILMNMAVNARDAMPNGGTLTIETRNIHVREDFARLHPGVRPAEYILLTVRDTGEGMTEEVLAHAFEPFFTTKSAGKGTGLGLAVIHGAVTQNGGRVEVTSTVGDGSTFHVYLPRVAPPMAKEQAVVASPVPRGTEVVLLVEDDAAVRQLISRLLVQHGYRVFAFASGEPALTWLGTTSEVVDLLLTDVIMPGMNGKQLADAVQQARPGLRVLFASGYTANVIAQHGVLEPDIPFLPKPFSARELVTRVREVLDAVR